MPIWNRCWLHFGAPGASWGAFGRSWAVLEGSLGASRAVWGRLGCVFGRFRQRPTRKYWFWISFSRFWVGGVSGWARDGWGSRLGSPKPRNFQKKPLHCKVCTWVRTLTQTAAQSAMAHITASQNKSEYGNTTSAYIENTIWQIAFVLP